MNLKIYTKLKIYFFYVFSLKYRDFYKFVIFNQKFSKSQVFQDLFAIYFSKFKKKGYFIEIGAGNGFDLSNTYLLEKKYKWKGIICEPNRRNQALIKRIRKVYLEKKPLTKVGQKKIVFFENKDPYQSSIRKNEDTENQYHTKTISLNQLLRNKRNVIDYISIDTEGNEFEIIKKFNFKKFRVKLISIEHNFNTRKRKKIFNLLKKNKFERIFENISYMDDWYINRN